MSDSLTFMMGEFAAEFPTDRLYAKNHMWAQPDGDGGFRFGFAAYAVRLLQDVYFLDWNVEAPATLTTGQKIGEIESSKAESALFAPLPGQLSEINAAVIKDPSAINVDKYGAGWLFKLTGQEESLFSPDEYLTHLETVWAVTQRTIKGQLNE